MELEYCWSLRRLKTPQL